MRARRRWWRWRLAAVTGSTAASIAASVASASAAATVMSRVTGGSVGAVAGPAASIRRAKTATVADKAVIERKSLRCMANVLRWVIGVVCNYNTETQHVKHPGSQLMAG